MNRAEIINSKKNEDRLDKVPQYLYQHRLHEGELITYPLKVVDYSEANNVYKCDYITATGYQHSYGYVSGYDFNRVQCNVFEGEYSYFVFTKTKDCSHAKSLIIKALRERKNEKIKELEVEIKEKTKEIDNLLQQLEGFEEDSYEI